VIPRAQALRALAEHEFDLVVVGGGITGAGVALDAATRGFSVALVERADFASGTSSRSSKLVHGGLRYLQNFDLALVREALLERQLMVALAPHLVHPLPLVVPAFDGARPDRLMGVGLNLYDAMSLDRDRLRSRRSRKGRGERLVAQSASTVQDEFQPTAPPPQSETGESWSPERHRTISGEEVLELLPALAAREPTSGYLFYDCQTDDVRLVLTVLGEAERFGAVCANRVDALSLLQRNGHACGVRALDRESGEEFEIRAANVVNATGVWADRLGAGSTSAAGPTTTTTTTDPDLAGGASAGRSAEESARGASELPRIRPSRGTHILLRHEDLPLVGGAIVPADAGRTIFALPWLGRTLVGTTDRDYEGELDHVRPSGEDIDYLLSAINEFFGTSFGAEDLAGAYAGVRPLISSGDPKKSVDISRKAELYEASSGMLTITGGKLTTWRRMAKLTVDRLVERDSAEAPCRTHEIPLGQGIAVEDLPRVEGVPEKSYAALAGRYGYAAREVLALAGGNGDARQGRVSPGFGKRGELAQPIVPGLPDLLAEVALAARREQARSIGDVLLRRTRLGLLAAHELPVQRVADVLARELHWSPERTVREIELFAEEAHAEGIRADTEGIRADAEGIRADAEPIRPAGERAGPDGERGTDGAEGAGRREARSA
jgi:glycerol-3-phosphate dehydrogenase